MSTRATVHVAAISALKICAGKGRVDRAPGPVELNSAKVRFAASALVVLGGVVQPEAGMWLSSQQLWKRTDAIHRQGLPREPEPRKPDGLGTWHRKNRKAVQEWPSR